MKLRKLFLTVLAGAALLMACDKKEVDLGPAKLTVNPTDVAFEQDMDSKDISLVATRDWAVTGLPDWIALSKESGAANPDAQKVVISVTQNEGYNRSATLTFSIGFARSVLHVSQAGPDGEVDNGDGSKTNPYNVEGVIAFVTALGDKESENNVYVKGKISAISEEYSTQYGNGAFTISDDGTTESPQFTAYRVLYLGNKKFASGDTQIKVGDDVILYGKVVNYKGNTPETAQGAAFLFSLNGVDKGGDGGSTGDAKGTGTLEDPYNPAGIAAVAAALADNAVSTESYYMKGKISKIAVSKNVEQTFANSGDYGNASFYITDSEDATGEFYIYQTYYLGNRKWVTGDTDIKVGDEVIVYGPVTKYVSSYGTTLETSGKGASYIYSLNGTTGSDTPPTPVVEPKGTGTKDDPFNVAAAIVKAKETGETVTADEYYIKGTVSAVSLSAEHKNADLDLVDVENGEVFKAFRIKGFEGADITGTEPIKKGDVVVVCGKIVNYKGNTPETDQGGKLITWNDKTSFDGQGGGGQDGGAVNLTSASTWTAATDATYKAGFEMTSSTGVKIGVFKGSGTTDIKAADEYSIRVYKNSVIVVSAPAGAKITGLSFKANDYDNGKYCCDLEYVEGGTGTMTADKTTMMIGTFSGSAEKIVLKATVGQTRLVEAYVTLDGQGGGGQGGGGDEEEKLPVNDGLTEETAFTVQDAIYVAKHSEEVKEYFVKAVVGKDVSIKNGVASFELMDGTTDGKLTVVKAKSFKGADFTGSEPLDWLDEVILKGKVTEYSTLPALTEGQIVKWNGKPTFLDPETDLSKVLALAKNADAYFDGVVSAITTKSIMVTDGTNNVYVYQPKAMAAIGDKVRVLGTAGAFAGLFQINKNAEVEILSNGNTVTYPDATDITADFDTYTATKNAFVKVVADVTVADNKVTVAIEGATTTLQVVDAPEALGLAALADKKAVITGYFGGTKTDNSKTTKCIIATKAEEYTTETPAWTLKNLSELVDGDIAVIVSIKGTAQYAMSNDKGTGAAPAAVAFTEGEPDATVLWTVGVSDGKLTFTVPEGTDKLYCTATNNGVRVGTNANNTFEIDSASGYLKNVATTRYLGVYNNADWRCYTNTTGNTAGQTFKAYVKTK